MQKYKTIILGPQCSGKTTLRKYLEGLGDNLPVVEEDQMLKDLNGGQYPKDIKYKNEVLRPKIEEYVRKAESVIFFTSYYDDDSLEDMREGGFKVLQLILSKDEFDRRNKNRMETEGYEDASVWAEDLFDFHNRVRHKKLIDLSVDASKPTEQIAKEVLTFLNS